MDPLQHVHIRKHHSAELFPHPNSFKRLFDRLILILGPMGPFIALPQIYKVWFTHETNGVSPITWGGLAVVATLWFTYGVLHNSKPIYITYALWIVMNSAVAIGVLVYS